MSLPWTSRPPANSGLAAIAPEYVTASNNARSLLSLMLERDLPDLELMTGLRNADKSLAGFYRYFDKTSNADVFLKLIAAGEGEIQERATRLVCWLTENGVNAIKTRKIITSNSYTLCISAFHDLRPPRLDATDMKKMGEALANLHKTMPDYPGIKRAVKDGKVRLEMLENRLSHVLDTPSNYPSGADIIPHLSSKLEQPFRPSSRASAVHGDLNIGNLAFDVQDGSFIFLDFEDALALWLPQETDLAMMLQRAVLEQKGNEADQITCGRLLIDTYHQANGPACFQNETELGQHITWLILRSLTMLCEMHARGEKIAEGEWQKFNTLTANLKRHAPVLKAICNA